ncbi:hypothetical protein QR680_008504 [Steinernema hermaphroditum]|uniref:Serpentine receptor class gamma n=1 Tax=Steinernema hermaphroditum TaxID=289476 RepID=A0AA39IIC5_9BILA|nr:hypothetical protein QR680_008504 [Steinernema hermaphroditum]
MSAHLLRSPPTMNAEIAMFAVSLLYGIPSFLLYVVILFQLVRPKYQKHFDNPFFYLCFLIGVVFLIYIAMNTKDNARVMMLFSLLPWVNDFKFLSPAWVLLIVSTAIREAVLHAIPFTLFGFFFRLFLGLLVGLLFGLIRAFFGALFRALPGLLSRPPSRSGRRGMHVDNHGDGEVLVEVVVSTRDATNTTLLHPDRLKPKRDFSKFAVLLTSFFIFLIFIIFCSFMVVLHARTDEPDEPSNKT